MAKAKPLESLDDLPGHQIRRLQQIAVGTFMDEAGDANITPVQFALLFVASRQPGLDQRTLAGTIGFDTSTIGAVVDRLEARGLIRRNPSPTDKRLRLLTITDDGRVLLKRVMPAMLRAQERMLAPLDTAEREVFMTMMMRVVVAHQGASRAAKDA